MHHHHFFGVRYSDGLRDRSLSWSGGWIEGAVGRCQEERRAVMLKQLIKWFGPEAQDPIDYVDTWILQFLEWIFKFCKYIYIYTYI